MCSQYVLVFQSSFTPLLSYHTIKHQTVMLAMKQLHANISCCLKVGVGDSVENCIFLYLCAILTSTQQSKYKIICKKTKENKLRVYGSNRAVKKNFIQSILAA